MSIKTVTFAKNGNGLDSIEIDTKSSTISRTCLQLPLITGRRYRLIKGGRRIEVLFSRGWANIPADIKSIV